MSPAVKSGQMKLAMEAQQASEDHSRHLKLLEQQYQNHSEMQPAKVSTGDNRLPCTNIPISDPRGAIESLVKVLTYHDESDSPNLANARRTKRSDKISRWLAEATRSGRGTTMASYEDIASNSGRIYFEKAGSKTIHKDLRVPVWFSRERKIYSQGETVQTQDIGPKSTASCSWYNVTDLEVRPTIKDTNSVDANNIVEPSATSKSNWDHVIDVEVEPNAEAERANRDRFQYTQGMSNAEEVNSLTGRN
ncbi:hypothetical protein B0O99DRAFT_636405 [Bisporella sp. PMI_857]|nr:hypothetical protein B0O99DRAFT_636405 [Bisporella sp. PMI_857]